MTFDRIYERNEWNGVETRSGPGSGSAATRALDRVLQAIVRAFDVHSVLDVGCGENFWMSDLPNYLGIDVSAVAIARARVLHPDRQYEVRDARLLMGISADLIICRDVIQHLSSRSALRVLDAIKRSGSRLLFASTYLNTQNFEIVDGAFYAPDLTQPPFSMPMPELLVFDGYDYEHGAPSRDARKFLGLWQIAMLGAT